MRQNVKIFLYFLTAIVLVGIIFLTSKAYYQRIGAYGCGDQCFNFVAAFFMLKGKGLYSQIFFNHQPLMAYLSYLIQKTLQPSTLYQLVLYHRLWLIVFSVLMDFLLVLRFRWAGIGFALFYETTKYYLTGHFFLPEAVVAYLVAYLFGLWWEKGRNRVLLTDYLLAPFFTWLVIFLREPYIPLAVLLYFLWLFPLKKKKIFSLLFLIFLSLVTLATLPLKDYFYDLIWINRQFVSNEIQSVGIQGIKLLKIFFYPLLIFFTGPNTYFHRILIGLDLVFLISALGSRFLITTILIMGLAGIRYIEPGTMYYQAFHLLPWYSLFLMAIFVRLKTMKRILLVFLAGIFFYAIFSRESFLRERVNSQGEFTLNYANYYAYGTVIKTLSRANDTLFLEFWDDLIYWQAGLDSAYQYSLYTPAMAGSPKFIRARLEMFKKAPPDFYYSYYGAGKNCRSLAPAENQSDYLQLYFSQNPTCLYLKKTKLTQITADQWQEVGKLGFHLPAKK